MPACWRSFQSVSLKVFEQVAGLRVRRRGNKVGNRQPDFLHAESGAGANPVLRGRACSTTTAAEQPRWPISFVIECNVTSQIQRKSRSIYRPNRRIKPELDRYAIAGILGRQWSECIDSL